MVNMGADALDNFTSPTQWLAGLGLAKPVSATVQGISKGLVKPIKEAMSWSKELSDTAKSVGSASKSSESIIKTIGEKSSKEVEPLKNTISREETDFKDVKKSLEKEMSTKTRLHNDKLELTRDKQKEIKETTKSDLESKEASLKEALQGKAEDITKYMKEEIPNQISSMNDIVGQHIDDIAEEMAKSGKGITQLDKVNLYKKTLEEADRLGIKTGNARKLLEDLHGQAIKDIKGEDLDTGLVDNSGRPIINKSSGRGQELIPFRDFLHQSREFKRLLNESKLSGSQGLNDEDIVGAIYNKHLDHYMEENVSNYKSMMRDYAPVIQTMKTARKIFKPGSQYTDEQGVSLLKKYALGSGTSGKEELVGDLGKSSRFGGGMNIQASELKSIGSQLKNVQENIKSFPRVLQRKFEKEIAGIKSVHEKQMGDLESQLEKAQGQSQMKVDSIKDKISDIEATTNERISHIQDVAYKLKAVKQKGAIAGTLGMVGLGIAGTKIQEAKHVLFH